MSVSLVEPSVLDSLVEGRHLRPGTLRDQVGHKPTLLVFLRHLGCPFTQEWLADLKQAVQSDPTLPAPLFFHMGNPDQGDAFFSDYAPEFRAVSDPNRRFYKAFRVPKAPAYQLLDPRVWACGVRAQRGGHKARGVVGHPFVLPGLFLLEADRVTWKFIPRHMGQLPDLEDLPRPLVVG